MKQLGENITQDEMVGSLYCSTDERAVQLLQMMTDPAYSRFTLGKLCQRVGLNSIDLLNAFRNYQLLRGIVEMSRVVPEVMADVAEDARSRMGICKGCQGKGLIDTRRCPQCEGAGVTRVPGDHRSRKLLFQTLRLIEK
jgi:hypothetical protein